MSKKKITAESLMTTIDGMSASEVLALFEEFLKDVEANNYKIVPTISTFADHIGQPRSDVHQWFAVHVTEAKRMRDMSADTIAMGAMLKRYVPAVTNFALKNWCGWEESPQKKAQKNREAADEKRAKEVLDEYIATRKKLRVV